MASLIKPGSVKILTKDGELQVSLTIDLNINLNTDGMNFDAKNKGENHSFREDIPLKEEKIAWEIPDFGDASLKIDFGKKEN